jgi:hypothetical protein
MQRTLDANLAGLLCCAHAAPCSTPPQNSPRSGARMRAGLPYLDTLELISAAMPRRGEHRAVRPGHTSAAEVAAAEFAALSSQGT